MAVQFVKNNFYLEFDSMDQMHGLKSVHSIMCIGKESFAMQ